MSSQNVVGVAKVDIPVAPYGGNGRTGPFAMQGSGDKGLVNVELAFGDRMVSFDFGGSVYDIPEGLRDWLNDPLSFPENPLLQVEDFDDERVVGHDFLDRMRILRVWMIFGMYVTPSVAKILETESFAKDNGSRRLRYDRRLCLYAASNDAWRENLPGQKYAASHGRYHLAGPALDAITKQGFMWGVGRDFDHWETWILGEMRDTAMPGIINIPNPPDGETIYVMKNDCGIDVHIPRVPGVRMYRAFQDKRRSPFEHYQHNGIVVYYIFDRMTSSEIAARITCLTDIMDSSELINCYAHASKSSKHHWHGTFYPAGGFPLTLKDKPGNEPMITMSGGLQHAFQRSLMKRLSHIKRKSVGSVFYLDDGDMGSFYCSCLEKERGLMRRLVNLVYIPGAGGADTGLSWRVPSYLYDIVGSKNKGQASQVIESIRFIGELKDVAIERKVSGSCVYLAPKDYFEPAGEAITAMITSLTASSAHLDSLASQFRSAANEHTSQLQTLLNYIRTRFDQGSGSTHPIVTFDGSTAVDFNPRKDRFGNQWVCATEGCDSFETGACHWVGELIKFQEDKLSQNFPNGVHKVTLNRTPVQINKNSFGAMIVNHPDYDYDINDADIHQDSDQD